MSAKNMSTKRLDRLEENQRLLEKQIAILKRLLLAKDPAAEAAFAEGNTGPHVYSVPAELYKNRRDMAVYNAMHGKKYPHAVIAYVLLHGCKTTKQRIGEIIADLGSGLIKGNIEIIRTVAHQEVRYERCIYYIDWNDWNVSEFRQAWSV